MRTAGFAAAGVGAIGLVTFAVLGSMSNSTFHDLEDSCTDGVCPPSRADDIDSGQSQQTVATVAAVIGVVGVAAGATLLTLSYTSKSGSDQGATAKAPASVEASLGLGSIAVRGSF